jgi:nucleotide-binding universal stress UspA family protein
MKTMLLPYHDEDAARAALNTAILLAKRFDSYIEGLLAFHAPTIGLGAFSPGMALPAEYLSLAVEEWRRFADGARTDFLKITGESGLPFHEPGTGVRGLGSGWSEMDGTEAEVVATHGRLFDLIVMGRTKENVSSRWRETCEAALFESGRPLLLAPAVAPASVGKSIVIGWNGSTETARTLAMAMPLLVAADRVEVLTVEGETSFGPGGAEIAEHLGHHGIAVSHRTLKPEGRPAGEVILDEAGDIGADLVLKGAFTRSRLRQVVFGGTTQHILDYAQVPVLLAH